MKGLSMVAVLIFSGLIVLVCFCPVVSAEPEETLELGLNLRTPQVIKVCFLVDKQDKIAFGEINVWERAYGGLEPEKKVSDFSGSHIFELRILAKEGKTVYRTFFQPDFEWWVGGESPKSSYEVLAPFSLEAQTIQVLKEEKVILKKSIGQEIEKALKEGLMVKIILVANAKKRITFDEISVWDIESGGLDVKIGNNYYSSNLLVWNDKKEREELSPPALLKKLDIFELRLLDEKSQIVCDAFFAPDYLLLSDPPIELEATPIELSLPYSPRTKILQVLKGRQVLLQKIVESDLRIKLHEFLLRGN